MPSKRKTIICIYVVTYNQIFYFQPVEIKRIHPGHILCNISTSKEKTEQRKTRAGWKISRESRFYSKLLQKRDRDLSIEPGSTQIQQSKEGFTDKKQSVNPWGIYSLGSVDEELLRGSIKGRRVLAEPG